jgi:hypothetical protein
MLDGKQIQKDLKRCFQCNCETYPYCNINGMVCGECFDVEHMEHRDYNEAVPGTFYKVKHRQSRCNSTKRARDDYTQDHNKLFYVVKTTANGDCLYESVSKAFGGKVTVKALRNLVSSKQSEDTFQIYKSLAQQADVGDDEFSIMNNITSLHEFRELIKKCGKDCGTNNCLWGDENAIFHISNEYRTSFTIFDKKGRFLQIIEPNEAPCRKHYIALQLDQKEGLEHFSLLKFDNHPILTHEMWNYVMERLAAQELTRKKRRKND